MEFGELEVDVLEVGGERDIFEKTHNFWNNYFNGDVNEVNNGKDEMNGEERTEEEKVEDWIVENEKIEELLKEILVLDDKILIVGCGSSTQGLHLHSLGYSHILNTDISEVVISSMSNLYNRCKLAVFESNLNEESICIPEIQEFQKFVQLGAQYPNSFVDWKVADCTNLCNLSDSSYNIVLDKGTSDTLQFRTKSSIRDAQLISMFSEVSRVLSPRLIPSNNQQMRTSEEKTQTTTVAAAAAMQRGIYIVITPRKRLPFFSSPSDISRVEDKNHDLSINKNKIKREDNNNCEEEISHNNNKKTKISKNILPFGFTFMHTLWCRVGTTSAHLVASNNKSTKQSRNIFVHLCVKTKDDNDDDDDDDDKKKKKKKNGKDKVSAYEEFLVFKYAEIFTKLIENQHFLSIHVAGINESLLPIVPTQLHRYLHATLKAKYILMQTVASSSSPTFDHNINNNININNINNNINNINNNNTEPEEGLRLVKSKSEKYRIASTNATKSYIQLNDIESLVNFIHKIRRSGREEVNDSTEKMMYLYQSIQEIKSQFWRKEAELPTDQIVFFGRIVKKRVIKRKAIFYSVEDLQLSVIPEAVLNLSVIKTMGLEGNVYTDHHHNHYEGEDEEFQIVLWATDDYTEYASNIFIERGDEVVVSGYLIRNNKNHVIINAIALRSLHFNKIK